MDAEGRVRFDTPPVLLGADRHSLEQFVDRYRDVSRPLRVGDVFAARTREVEEGEARLEPMLEPEEWIEPPVYDLTPDARDAAKASFSAAVTPTLGPAEMAQIADLIEHPAAPPPPPPPPPSPPRPWWRSPFAQVAAAGIVFAGGLTAGFVASASSGTTVTDHTTSVDFTTSVSVSVSITVSTDYTTVERPPPPPTPTPTEPATPTPSTPATPTPSTPATPTTPSGPTG